jgi:hypothetical protein
MMNCATIQEKHYLKQFYSTENWYRHVLVTRHGIWIIQFTERL